MEIPHLSAASVELPPSDFSFPPLLIPNENLTYCKLWQLPLPITLHYFAALERLFM